MGNKYFCPKCGKELKEENAMAGICPYCHGFFDVALGKIEKANFDTQEYLKRKSPEEIEKIEKLFTKENGGKMRRIEEEETESQLQKVPPLPSTAGYWNWWDMFGISLFLSLVVGFPIALSIWELGKWVQIVFLIFFVFLLWIAPIWYMIENNKRYRSWMWTIECPQCGYIGEKGEHFFLIRPVCPRCSWSHVIRLGWRRRE